MNYLTASLIRTKTALFSQKKLFLLLFLLQFLFIGLMAVIALNYQLRLFNDLQQVIDPLQKANLDQASLEAGNPVLDDLLPLLRGYRQLSVHVRQLAWWLALLFLGGNGLLWGLSFSLIQKRPLKELFQIWLKSLALGGLFLAALFIAVKIIFNNWFDPEEMAASLKLSFKIAVGVSLIIYYLFLTAMAQANSKSWKEFFKKTSFSFSRIYYFTPIFLINLSLIGGSLYFILTGNNYPLGLILLLIILFFIIIIASRIFWLTAVNVGFSANSNANINAKILRGDIKRR